MAGPGGVEVGRGRLVVLPDVSLFGKSLKKYVERVERQLVIQVPTQLDVKGLAADLKAARANLERDAVNVRAEVESIGDDVRATVAEATRTAPPVRVRAEVDRSSLSALTTVTGQIRTSVASVGATLATWGPAIVAAGAGAVSLAPAIGVVGTASIGAGLAVGTLALGLSGLGDAIEASSDPKKFAEAMRGLSAEAQKTVKTIVGLKPAFQDLRTSVQDALLKGIGPSIQRVANTFLPVLRSEMTAMAAAFNTGARNFAAFVTSGPGLQLIRDNLAAARSAMAPLGAAFKPLTTALLQIGIAAAPAFRLLNQGLANAAIAFAGFIDRASRTGQLQAAITGAVRGIGALLGGIGAVLRPLVTGLAAAGPSVVAGLAAALRVVGSVISAVVAQAPKLAPIFATLGTIVAPLAAAFRQLAAAALPVAQQVFTALATAGGPVLSGVLRVLVATLTPVIAGFRAFLQIVGPQLGPTITAIAGFIRGLLPTLQQFGQQIGDTVGKGLREIGQVIATNLLPAFQRILPVLQPVARFLLTVLGGAVVGAIRGVINVIKGVLQVFGGLLDFITGVFTGDWSRAWEGIKTIFSGIWNAIKGVVEVAWNSGVIGLFRKGVAGIKALVTGLGPTLKTQGAKALDLLKTSISTGLKAAIKFFVELPGQVIKATSGFGSKLVQLGMDLIRGLIEGIRQMGAQAIGAVTNIANDAVNAAKRKLGIASPSKVMIEIGRFVGEGLVVGLLGSRDQVASATQDLAQKVADAIQSLTDRRSSIAEQITADAAKVKQAQTDYAAAVKAAGASGSAAVKAAALRLKQAQDKLARDRKAGKGSGVIVADKAAVARAELAYRNAVAAQGKAAQKAIETARKKLVTAVTRLGADRSDLRELDASFLGLADGSAQARLQSLIDSSNERLGELADQRAKIADELKAAQDRLAEALRIRDDYARQLRDAVVAFGDVTRAQANAAGRISASSIVSSLRKQLAAIVAYRRNVELLRSGGLSDAALQQILAAGVEGGAATAAGIVAGGRDAIAAVNSLTSQIAAEATGLGTEGARWFYQAGVDVASSIVAGLEQQQAEVDRQSRELVDGLVGQIKDVLGIAVDGNGNVTGGVMYSVGESIGQQMAAGIDASRSLVQQAAARLASAAGGSAPAVPSGGSLGRGTIGGGAPVVVNNYNPVPEPASTTTTRTLRTLALLGPGK